MQDRIYLHFQKSDVLFYKTLTKAGKIRKIAPITPSLYFSHLCMQIVNQQLSEKAGDTIFARFKKLFLSGLITPSKVIKIGREEIRNSGISSAKTEYIHNLAFHFLENREKMLDLKSLSDSEVTSELTRIKGIGLWTAEMFLIFALGREDVFSPGDLGLRKAVAKLYKFKSLPTTIEMKDISLKWSPFRSHACRVLWASL